MEINLNDLIIILIASSGLAWVITIGKGFQEVREAATRLYKKHPNYFTKKLDLLLCCPFCMGFWTSLICYFIYTYCGIVGNFIIFALLGAICSLFIYSLIKYFKDY